MTSELTKANQEPEARSRPRLLARAKPKIFLGSNQLHVGKLLGHHFWRTVS